MPGLIGAAAIVILMGMVATRVLMLELRGISALHFGKLDRTDFLIPPFVLFYFYLIFAAAFDLPTVSTQRFFDSEAIAWAGAGLCLLALLLMAWSLVSFEQSFRVGIDVDQPDKLITTGAFAFSRNPIYVAFACLLLGQFLITPNWILLVYLAAGIWLLHRQVLREEVFLKQHYGEEYLAYCQNVRRYF